MSINLSGCFSQQLKALLACLSKMYFFNVGRFSAIGAHGNTGGVEGGSCLIGQEQVLSFKAGTPELEHLVGLI